MATQSLYDLAILDRADEFTGLIEDVTTLAPEFSTFYAHKRPGTWYKTVKRTTLPVATARIIGTPSCKVKPCATLETGTLGLSNSAVTGSAAMLMGMKPEDVHVIFTMGSGCYGLNGADTVSYDAALMSQAVGKPVRVQLSRKDEMVWGENYGLPFAVDQEVGLDASGTIVAWNVDTWSAQLGNRPGTNAPGNVASGMLAGFAPASVQPRAQAPDVTNWDNGNNAVPAYVKGVVGGKAGGTGVVASERVLTHTVPSPFLTGPLRSPARLQNAFAQECFMDEVAAQVKADPVDYRLRHLADPRLKEVVTAAAKTAGWDTRPSPKPGNAKTGVVTGRGVAWPAWSHRTQASMSGAKSVPALANR